MRNDRWSTDAEIKGALRCDRVKFFWEKSSAGIEWPEFGASFE